MGVALATPFTESGEVDYDALAGMVRSQLAGGVDLIFVLLPYALTFIVTNFLFFCIFAFF